MSVHEESPKFCPDHGHEIIMNHAAVRDIAVKMIADGVSPPTPIEIRPMCKDCIPKMTEALLIGLGLVEETTGFVQGGYSEDFHGFWKSDCGPIPTDRPLPRFCPKCGRLIIYKEGQGRKVPEFD